MATCPAIQKVRRSRALPNFESLVWPRILAGLLSGEIEAAELQELAMMAEAAQVAGFGKDGHCIDRTDAWDLAQALVVGVLAEQVVGLSLDLVALTDQATSLGNDHPEHTDGRASSWQRQADRGARRLVDIGQKPGF